jgi:hypothetical protein
LKKLATDPKYTYDNTVVTDDVEKLFSKESGEDLKPLFDLYLRTINKLEINVKQVSDSSYTVKLVNYNGVLPLDISVDGKTERKLVNKTGISITSSSGLPPAIDPVGYYLKKVVLE